MKKLLLFAAMMTATVFNLSAASVTKSSFASPEIGSGNIAMDQHISLLDGGSAFMPGSGSTLNFCADSKYPGLSMTISCSNGTITSFQLTFTLTQNVQIYYNSQAITSGTTVTLSTPASSVVLYSYLSGSPSGQPLATISSITVNYEAQDPDMHDFLYFTSRKADGTGTVHLDKMRAETPSTFEYSMDRKTWTAYDSWTTVSQTRKKGNPIALNQGDTVFFRAKGVNGKNATVGTNNAYFTFFFGKDDSIAVGGNIMSLYDASCEQDTMTEYGFYWLFYQNKNLVSAADLKLPAKKLAKNCYESMFDYCTALTDAPKISAETAAKYSCYYMFRGCTSLTTAPALPATKMAENCYQQMFNGCTALTQVPEMKADSLATLCYYGMFSGCTSLQVDTCADGSCDGVKFNPTTVGTEPTNWGAKMFQDCKGTVTRPQLNGHYCIRKYIAPYTREVTSGNYGTICLDKKFNAMEGVEGLYVPSYKDASKLYCSEVKLSDVVAGGAYIFKADSAVIVLTLEGEAVAAAVNNDHMIGWLAADSTLSATFVSDHAGYALLASNQIVSPQSGSQILKNRAFIDLANVSTNPPSAAGRYIALGINEATGLDEMHGQRPNAQIQNAECKMLVNGQLIIIKDGVKYNAQGQKLE